MYSPIQHGITTSVHQCLISVQFTHLYGLPGHCKQLKFMTNHALDIKYSSKWNILTLTYSQIENGAVDSGRWDSSVDSFICISTVGSSIIDSDYIYFLP